MYGDKIQIRDINGQIEVDSSFENYYNDRIYTVIDKQALGEYLGRKILDEHEEPDFDFDVIDNCHIAYEEIDGEIINDIVNDIFGYIEEYINNNQ